MVYMPSTPTTPSMIPMMIPRTCSPIDISAQPLPSGCVASDYVPPNGALLPTFTQHQGWAPDNGACNDVYVNVFDMPPPLDPLTIPSGNVDALFKSPSSYTNSSGPPSPHMSPYTPTTLETLHVGVDAWQAQTCLPMFDATPQFPLSLEYQPYSWGNAPDLWVNGGAPMFNEDFDITMIPPISIEVPKFDGSPANMADPPCAQQDFLSPQSCEQEGRNAFAPVFTFNEIPVLDGF